MISACGPPATSWDPRPTTTPSSSTMTAPTIGLGLVVASPRSARASARAMYWRSVTSPFVLEQRGGVILGRKRDQIVDPLADADIADRQLQVVGDGHGDPTLGGAVELGEDDAVDARDARELARLGEAVLPHCRVEHQQHLVRRPVHLPGRDPLDLVQLGHEV